MIPTRPAETAPSTSGDSPPEVVSAEPWFARLARFSATHRRAVMIVWLIATIAAAPLAVTLTGALSGAGWEAQGSTSMKVRDELRRDFPQLGAEAAVVVYRQTDPISGSGRSVPVPCGAIAGICSVTRSTATSPSAARSRRTAREALSSGAATFGRFWAVGRVVRLLMSSSIVPGSACCCKHTQGDIFTNARFRVRRGRRAAASARRRSVR